MAYFKDYRRPWALAAVCGALLAGCDPGPDPLPGSSAEDTDDEPDPSTGDEPGEPEEETEADGIPACPEPANSFSISDPNRGVAEVVEESPWANNFTAELGCSVSTSHIDDSTETLVTTITLTCVDNEAPFEKGGTVELVVSGLGIDLGDDPLTLSYFRELGPRHTHGDEAVYSMRVQRGETMLLQKTDDLRISALELGAARFPEPCIDDELLPDPYDEFECLALTGVSALDARGQLVERFDGGPLTIRSDEGDVYLATKLGYRPIHCDGSDTELWNRGNVWSQAVATSVVVRR
ncbi:MAG: hypothetical protein AAF799_28120 [Myxococcota bacterium]